jgi:hypothetical protein
MLFCFLFMVLFAGVYKAGQMYRAKTLSARGADLCVLSGAAVYCNELQWVRYANAALLVAFSVDLIRMATAALAAGGLSAGSGALAAALAVDRTNLRTPLQNALKPLFGIETTSGVLPWWIYRETREAAKGNRMAISPSAANALSIPMPPLLLFNLQTCGASSVLPNLNLRFRTLEELLSDLEDVAASEPLYLSYDRAMTFTSSQVQPCKNAHPGQMCVKSGTPKYGGTYCESIPGVEWGEAAENPILKPMLGKVKWALKALRPLLKDIRLDITHRTNPPDHTLLFYGFLSAGGRRYHQTSEARVEGPGLAAWDIPAGPYRARLITEEFDRLILIQPFLQACPNLPRGFFTDQENPTPGGSFAR